jgi:mono/diheme cytochrome c family protein
VKFLIAALAAGAVLGAAFVAGPAPSAAARPPISFTAAQASTGQAAYYANCAKCHGANLEGISGPALKGKDGNLQEQTVSGVYTYTITQMPVGNAGGLPSTDYVNIMAFLLQSNGRRPGQAKLSVATLKADSSKVGGPK